jgi:hypothetical protein
LSEYPEEYPINDWNNHYPPAYSLRVREEGSGGICWICLIVALAALAGIATLAALLATLGLVGAGSALFIALFAASGENPNPVDFAASAFEVSPGVLGCTEQARKFCMNDGGKPGLCLDCKPLMYTSCDTGSGDEVAVCKVWKQACLHTRILYGSGLSREDFHMAPRVSCLAHGLHTKNCYDLCPSDGWDIQTAKTTESLDRIKFFKAFDNKRVCSTKSNQYGYPHGDSIMVNIGTLTDCAEYALKNGFVYFSFYQEFYPAVLTKCVGFHSKDCKHTFEQQRRANPVAPEPIWPWTTYAIIGQVATPPPTPAPTKRCFGRFLNLNFGKSYDLCWTDAGPGYAPDVFATNGCSCDGIHCNGWKKFIDEATCMNAPECQKVSYYGCGLGGCLCD